MVYIYQLTWLLFDDVWRKKRNEPGESMVCCRDKAAFGFDTLFWRNHGNEIFRRLFCDLVGTKPSACCCLLLSLPLMFEHELCTLHDLHTNSQALEFYQQINSLFAIYLCRWVDSWNASISAFCSVQSRIYYICIYHIIGFYCVFNSPLR